MKFSANGRDRSRNIFNITNHRGGDVADAQNKNSGQCNDFFVKSYIFFSNRRCNLQPEDLF